MTREGLRALSAGKYTDAELQFRRSLALFPEADNVRRNLARALLLGGDPAAAEAEYRHLLGKRGRAAIVPDLAEAVLRQGREGEAIDLFESLYAEALARQDEKAQSELGLKLAAIYFKVGREEEALCRAEEGYRANRSAKTAERYGALLIALHRPREALTEIESFASSQEGPLPTELVVVRSLGLFALGEPDLAGEAAKVGLEVDGPRPAGATQELEMIVALTGNDSGAASGDARSGTVWFERPNPRWVFFPPPILRTIELFAGSHAG
ncbi:MAG: hypothetical protein RL417_2319 [Pseudomonadota bacterium]|jgi:tetratricopeptide (TPR) repeat protein